MQQFQIQVQFHPVLSKHTLQKWDDQIEPQHSSAQLFLRGAQNRSASFVDKEAEGTSRGSAQ